MAEITVNGKAWHYEESSYITGEIYSLNKEDALYMLRTIKKVFDDNGIKFMLMYGTLLGAVREKDFIGHDLDMDIDIYAKDRQKMIDLIPVLDKYGIKFTRHAGKLIYTFVYKSADCDIDIIYEARWPLKYRYNYTLGKYYPKFYVSETEKIEFHGDMYDIPKNPERFLAYIYGKDWKIPQKGKHGNIQSKALIHINLYRFAKRCISYIKRHYLS